MITVFDCNFKHFLLIVLVIIVRCDNVGCEPNFFDFKQIKRELFSQNDLGMSNLISELMSYNWTENHECLNELIAIQNGFVNFDEWALTSNMNSYYSLK